MDQDKNLARSGCERLCSRQLTLDSACSQTRNNLPFRKEVENNGRDGRQQHKCRDQRQICGVLTLELHGAQRQSPEFITVQNDERRKQVIPTHDHCQRGNGGKCRPCQGEQDTPEEIKVGTAIDVSGILQFRRDGSEETAQDQNIAGDIERNLHQNNTQETVDQLDAHVIHLAKYEVDRQNCDRDGEHQPQGKEVEEKILGAKLKACKNKSSQPTNEDNTDCGRNHQDHAVKQHAPESWRTQYPDKVFPVGRVRNRIRVRIHFTGGLETAKDQNHERRKDNHYNDGKNQVLKEPCQKLLCPARKQVSEWHG